MNDFAAVLMNNTTQSLSYNKNAQGTANKSGKDAGDANFSTALKNANLKASQVARGSKKDITKTSEEMVAYAASSNQTTNNQPAADKADNTTDNVSAVSNQTTTVAETQTLNTQEVATEVAQVLDVDQDQLSELLQLLDVELPPEMSSDDLPNFLVKLLTMMDEHLGAIAEAALPESQTSTAQLIAALLGNGQPANETAKVTPITTDAAEVPVVNVNVTVTSQEAVVVTPDAETADTGEEPVFTLPVVTDDGATAVLQQARDRLAAYVVKNNLSTEEVPVEGEADPVAATDMAVTDMAADDVVVNQASKNTSGENTSEEDKEGKQSDVQADDAYMSKVEVSTIQPAQAANTANVASVADVEVQPQVQVNTQDIINQIVEAARLTTADGTSQLEIQLHPQHLGKVGIVLTATEDGVTAHIKTPNDTVNQLLNAGMSDLLNSLKELGINMKNINVSQSELGWDFARGQAGQQMPQQQQGEQHQQNNSGRRNQVIRLADPQMSRLSNMLYGTSALQPMMREDVSVDFQA